MECPKCHAENRDDSRFCSNCAAPLNQAPPAHPSLSKTLETAVRILKTGSLVAGKYKIIEEVGHGGMGIVYKAEDIKLKRSVALKFLPRHLMDSPELKERFLIEAQAAAALSHPNICVIHEVKYEEVSSYMSAADIAVIFREKNIVNEVASPVKFSEYACSGLPVISNKNVEVIKSYIEETGYGLLINSVDDINSEAVDKLTSISRNKISEYGRMHFGIESVAGKYINAYKEMFEKRYILI